MMMMMTRKTNDLGILEKRLQTAHVSEVTDVVTALGGSVRHCVFGSVLG